MDSRTNERITRVCWTTNARLQWLAISEEDAVGESLDQLDVAFNKWKGGGIRQKSERFEVTASFVRALDGKDVDSAAVHSAFIRGFKKRGWAWPKSFESLRRYFLAHPPEGL